MSIPDSAVRNWFDLVTRWTPGQVEDLLGAVERGEVHPMEAKKRLAWEIASIYDGDEAAGRAADYFARVHQQRELPEDMPSLTLDGPTNVIDVIHAAGFARSKSEARRLVQQGAVRLDGDAVTTIETDVDPARVLQVGKRRFLRLLAR
jgi:tyrosyl-tRNA synthetase